MRLSRVHAAVRLVGAVLVGLAAAAVVAATVDRATAGLTLIAVTATVFVVWGWASLWPLDAEGTSAHALREDYPHVIDEVVVVVAAVGGLAGAFTLLGSDTARTGLLALLDVVMCWAAVHLMYAVRYAAMYYDAEHPPSGGIDFNDEHAPPRYQDFLYFSYNLGMTYAVSDNNVGSTRIRAVVLRQALLSYLFGAAIIANAINVVVRILAG